MDGKPTYEELEERVQALEKEASDRIRAEEALRESEVRLKTVLDTIQAGIVVIDPDSHIIVGVNAAAGKMISAPRQHILGRLCHEFICLDDKDQCPVTDRGQILENEESVLLTANGEQVPILKTVVSVALEGREHLLESFLDITERKEAEKERERLIDELQAALAEVKALSGLLPICASCKSIRDDQGYWQQIEAYIGDHSEAEFSHSVCPKCARKLYPEIYQDK
jgi:PAS domain S-box-containing protein